MINFLALITWTLFIWVWSAGIWYNRGLSDGKEIYSKGFEQKEQKLEKIKEICKPIINISTIDRLSGEQNIRGSIFWQRIFYK